MPSERSIVWDCPALPDPSRAAGRANRPTPRRHGLAGCRGQDLLEAVEDEIEPERSRAHHLSLRLRDVLLGVLGKVWELVGKLFDECRPEVRGELHGRVAGVPER